MDTNLDPDADCFKPPPGSILVECIHCGEEYESYRIEWRVFDRPDGPCGFWCCPIEGCDGAGFGFDIFPVDPEQAAQFGITFFDDNDDDDEENTSDPYPDSFDDPPSMEDDIPF